MRSRRALVALGLTVVLFLSGCVPGTQGQPDVDVAGLTSVLESGGVVVADSPDDTEAFARGAVVVLPEQVQSMAYQLDAGAGASGSDLDGFVAVGSGLPPMAFILGGWAKEWDGDGAAAARTLLGDDVDWNAPELIPWSNALLALFLADIPADLDPEEYALASSIGPSVATAAFTLDVGALCTAGADFIQNALATVFAAINYAAQKAEEEVGGFLGSIIGIGIRLFGEVVKGVVQVVEGITAKILAPIKDALIVIAILQQAASLLQPWTVKLVSDPAALVAGPDEIFGSVRATITSFVPDFPPWLKQCAAALSLTLPEPPGKGANVKWAFEPPTPLWAQEVGSNKVVQTDNTASLQYHVNAEPPETWGGDALYPPYQVRVGITPERTELETLNKFADSLIQGELAKVPESIRGIVSSVVATIRTEVIAQLHRLLTPGVTTSLPIPLVMHGLKEVRGKPIRLPDPAVYNFCLAYLKYAEWTVVNTDGIWGAIFPDNILDPVSQAAAFREATALLQPQQDPVIAAMPSYMVGSIGQLLRYSSDKSYDGPQDLAFSTPETAPIESALNSWYATHCPSDLVARWDAAIGYWTWGGLPG